MKTEVYFRRSNFAVSIEVLFITNNSYITKWPQHTEKLKWRNALWEDLEIFSADWPSLV